MKLYKFLLVCFLGLSLNSCGDLTEVNVDPEAISSADLNLLLPEVQAQAANNLGYNPYRVAGLVMQQFLGLDAQQIQYYDYILGEDAMNNYWRNGLYAGVLKSANVLKDQAIEEGNPFYSGVAKVIFASQLGDATAMFGDIPLTEAFKGIEVLKPKYDSQESVYAAVIAMLDDAIVDLKNESGSHVGGDLIYGGDASLWIKAANSFKARYLMHTAKRNPGNVALAVAAANQGVSSNAENPAFPFETAQTANNPLAAFGQERPNTLGFNPQFIAMLEGDPRLGKYTVNKDGVDLYFDLGNADLVWAQDNSAIPLISYTEMLFIKAEANAGTAVGDADLAAAVMSNMALNGVDADAAQAYVDGLGSASLETVMTEAYKAYYGYNFLQTWTNYRRTGLPALAPNPAASLSFDPSGVIPERYLYVDSESQTNGDNVEAAEAAQGGGLLDVTLWAFK